MIECCILPTSWQYDSGAETSLLLFQLLTALQIGGKEWQSVQCKRSDQENEDNGSHGSKIEERVIQRDSSSKRGKFLKKRKTRKRNTSFSFQSRSLPRQRKKRSQKPTIRNKGGDLLVHICFHLLLIPRALRVRKKTKKPRDSILYRIKTNLNGTSRLSLHLSKTTVWEIHPREKYSRRNL